MQQLIANWIAYSKAAKLDPIVDMLFQQIVDHPPEPEWVARFSLRVLDVLYEMPTEAVSEEEPCSPESEQASKRQKVQ